MNGLFGTRVRPMMNLSVEDVRGYLGNQLERLNNKRLKVGTTFRDWGEQTMKDAVKQGLTPVRLGLEVAERAVVAAHLSNLRQTGGNG